MRLMTELNNQSALTQMAYLRGKNGNDLSMGEGIGVRVAFVPVRSS